MPSEYSRGYGNNTGWVDAVQWSESNPKRPLQNLVQNEKKCNKIGRTDLGDPNIPIT